MASKKSPQDQIKSPYVQAGKGRPRKLADHSYDHDQERSVGRLDSWLNWNTGLGDVNFDKSVATYYQRDARVDDDQLAGLYYGNDIAKLIVDSNVDESFRVGYDINIPDDTDNESKDALDVWKPAIDTAVRDLLRWSRLYGGAAVYLDVDDGASLLDPLDVSRVKKINSLRVFDRRFVWPLGYDTDPTSPTYWLPEYYGFGGSLAGSMMSPRVHHSRLLRAVGLEADRREAQYLFWWGHSVLQPVYQVLLRLGLAEQSTVSMMQDATQFIYYLKGLIDAIAAKDSAGIQARMRVIDMQRGVGRALLLDAGQTQADAEKVEKLTTPFTGVADMLSFFQGRVAAAARMPVSILFGTGFKGGLSDKGEGDLRNWHSGVQNYQQKEVEPALRRLYALVGQILDIDTSEMKFNWRQLYEPTAAEQALVYFQTAQADEIYMTAGAIRPEEIAISRWGSGKYSTDTSIDVDLYRASLVAAPAPTQAAPGVPVVPPAPSAGNATGNAGPVTPPAGVATEAASPVAEKPEINASNDQVISKEGALAPGEVGGSNRMTEPQIVDVTGRGTPVKDRERNQIPADVSGTKPDDTPVQQPKPATKATTPGTDDPPAKAAPEKPIVHVKAGDVEVKIKKPQEDK